MRIGILLVIIGFSFTISAQSDTSLNKNDSRKIELRNDQWESPGAGYSTSGGMYMQHPDSKFNRHYFSIGDSLKDIRVNYLATNLAQTVKPVPSAYEKLKTYKVLRILTPTLMVTGLGVGIVGFSKQMDKKDENGDIPPPNFTVPIIGLVIAMTSWVPRIISKGMVEKSVDIYNAEIQK